MVESCMAAGFDYARGDVIVTMDADPQNDPRDIPLLLENFLLSYSTRPIHVFAMFRFGSSGLGFFIAFVMIIQRQFWGIAMGDRPLLLLAILLIVSSFNAKARECA